MARVGGRALWRAFKHSYRQAIGLKTAALPPTPSEGPSGLVPLSRAVFTAAILAGVEVSTNLDRRHTDKTTDPWLPWAGRPRYRSTQFPIYFSIYL